PLGPRHGAARARAVHRPGPAPRRGAAGADPLCPHRPRRHGALRGGPARRRAGRGGGDGQPGPPLRGAMRWLFSPALDLAAFLLPPLLYLLTCGSLFATGGLYRPLSPALWHFAVVAVDVAHVFATAYWVYADPAELRRRP